MGLFCLSTRKLAEKAALVTPTGIDPQALEDRLTQKKSPPSQATWRVLVFKDGTEIATRKNYSWLARKVLGIRSRLDEEGVYLDRQKATAESLYARLGGAELLAAKRYFSSVREVSDCAEYRRCNRVMAAAKTGLEAMAQCSATMRAHRAGLLQLAASQVRGVEHAQQAREMAVELNAVVGPSSPGSLALTSEQQVLLRTHIRNVSDQSEWTQEKTIESILIKLPAARWLDGKVFDALVDYYVELAEQRLRAPLAPAMHPAQ